VRRIRREVLFGVGILHISSFDRSLPAALAGNGVSVGAFPPSSARAHNYALPHTVESPTPGIEEELPLGLHFDSKLMPLLSGSMLSAEAPSCQRKASKSMARRKGQRGTVELKGNLYWGKYYADTPGLDYRPQRRVCIGSVFAMTKTEAKRRLPKILDSLGVNSHEYLERSFEPVVTFTQQADKWIEDVKTQHANDGEYARVKRGSFPSMKSIINLHLKPRFGDTAIDEIDQKNVDNLIKELAIKGKAKNTIRNVVTVVGIVLGKTFQTRKALKDLKVLKQRKNTKTKVLWFTGAEMSSIIGNARNPRARALFATAAGTGMRASELYGLRVEDVDLDKAVIFVRRSVSGSTEGSTKTENADRIIGIDDSLVQLLRNWIGDRKFGYVFPSNSGTPLLNSNVLEDDLHPGLAKLGIEKKGMHGFRHGRVTVLVESGVPTYTIKAWIGHGSEKMVEKYTHHRAEYHQQHLAKVPKVVMDSPISPIVEERAVLV
jgi:integrase